jgi:hypothetical protein
MDLSQNGYRSDWKKATMFKICVDLSQDYESSVASAAGLQVFHDFR